VTRDATQDEEVGQNVDHIDRLEVAGDTDRQAFMGELVEHVEHPDGSSSVLVGRHGAMNPAGRLGIRNIAGLELKKDAAERVSSTRGKYEPSKKEPRVGGARGSGRQKGLGGF
jgi:hypothetical protein